MKQFVNKHTKAKTLIAKSSIQINNTIDEAWKALVNPEIVEKYMLGITRRPPAGQMRRKITRPFQLP